MSRSETGEAKACRDDSQHGGGTETSTGVITALAYSCPRNEFIKHVFFQLFQQPYWYIQSTNEFIVIKTFLWLNFR